MQDGYWTVNYIGTQGFISTFFHSLTLKTLDNLIKSWLVFLYGHSLIPLDSWSWTVLPICLDYDLLTYLALVCWQVQVNLASHSFPPQCLVLSVAAPPTASLSSPRIVYEYENRFKSNGYSWFRSHTGNKVTNTVFKRTF